MRALRKGQAAAFNITRNICSEARIVERAFGLGASALAEAAQFLEAQLQIKAASPANPIINSRLCTPSNKLCNKAIATPPAQTTSGNGAGRC